MHPQSFKKPSLFYGFFWMKSLSTEVIYGKNTEPEMEGNQIVGKGIEKEKKWKGEG